MASGEAFAATYEGVFQHNRYLATEADSTTRNLQVDVAVESRLTENAKHGLLIGVDGELSVMQDGYVEDNPVGGVYYLAPDVALRGDISEPILYEVEDLQSVAVEETQTVYCSRSP